MRTRNNCHITPLPDTDQRRAALIEELRARASPPIGQAPGRYMRQAMKAAERRAARPGFTGKATVHSPFGPLPITRTAPDRLSIGIDGYSLHWYA